MSKLFCLVAGGSGGHIIPGIMHISQTKKDDDEVLFFSTRSSLDRAVHEKFPFSCTYVRLPMIPLPGKKIWRYPLFFYRLATSFLSSVRILKRTRPESVTSMGGLVSLPVCLAAWWLGIPVTLFELNAVPGKAVRWLAPLAQRIYVCFNKAGSIFDPAKVYQVDYPLRFNKEHKLSKVQACKQIGLDPSKKVVLILGGSQGSRAINNLMMMLLKKYPDFMGQLAVIHQTGASQIAGQTALDYYSQVYADNGIDGIYFDFVADLHPYYSAADVVICRAGAGTLFELEFFNKQSLLVPLELSAEGHQLENALAMIQKRADLFSLVRQPHCEDDIKVLYSPLNKALDKSD